MMQVTREMDCNDLQWEQNALRLVLLNREDGDQVGVILQKIGLSGEQNVSIARMVSYIFHSRFIAVQIMIIFELKHGNMIPKTYFILLLKLS